MAAKIDESSDSQDVPIDWTAETSVCTHPEAHHSLDNSDSDLTSTVTTGLGIVLTGARGFLGSVILERLIANPYVSKIHCVPSESATAGTAIAIRPSLIRRESSATPVKPVTTPSGFVRD